MYKYILKSVVCVAVLMLATACASDESVTFPEGTVFFKAEMTSPTRATDVSFEQNDRIAVMYKGESASSQWNFFTPCEYVYDGSQFKPASEENPVVKKPSEKCTYIAYYPFVADLLKEKKFEVNEDQTSHEKYTSSDFCAAWKDQTDEKTVDLTFYHCLSKIVVNMRGANLAGGITAELRDMALETTLDLASREFVAGEIRGNVKMSNNGTLSYKAIVAPQTIKTSSDFLVITVNGREFPLRMQQDMELKSGREYVFNVEIINGVVIGFDTQLRPWNSNSNCDEYTEEHFSIENATFSEGTVEPGDKEPEDFNIGINDSALAGGMNFIIIKTGETFKSFQVFTEGVSGYWECSPQKEDNKYRIPIMYGMNIQGDVNMRLVGVYPNGTKTKSYDCTARYVESKIGDLNINLTFSTAKDVDLHLYTPSGNHIYYSNRGGTAVIDGVTYSYGLDHDSNPGCHIDNLNNENIFIPAAMIEPGEYKVIVNMYSNCNTSVNCEWAIAVRYNGEFVYNKTAGKGNPASGVYAASCGNGDMTEALRFTLIEPSAGVAPFQWNKLNVTPRRLSVPERMKIEYSK